MPQPIPLAAALTELIALRGFARRQGDAQLDAAWTKATDDAWRGQAVPRKIVRGVLQVDVQSPALLSELASFQTPRLLERLQQHAPHLRIKGLKYRLA